MANEAAAANRNPPLVPTLTETIDPDEPLIDAEDARDLLRRGDPPPPSFRNSDRRRHHPSQDDPPPRKTVAIAGTDPIRVGRVAETRDYATAYAEWRASVGLDVAEQRFQHHWFTTLLRNDRAGDALAMLKDGIIDPKLPCSEEQTWQMHGDGSQEYAPVHYHEYPLDVAAATGQLDVVMYLVEHGADVNQPGNCGDPPLAEAAGAGHAKIVEVLLAHGARINDVTPKRFTALHLAAARGHPDAVRALLAHRAEPCDLDLRDMLQRTAEECAIAHKRPDTAQIIADHRLALAAAKV